MQDDTKPLKMNVPIWWDSWQDWAGGQQGMSSETFDAAQLAWEAAWDAAQRRYAPDPRTKLSVMPTRLCECGEPLFLDDVGFQWGVRTQAMHPTEHGHVGSSADGLYFSFTGTREELTGAEKDWVKHIIRKIVPHGATLVTGGCVGLDAYVAELGATVGQDGVTSGTACSSAHGRSWSRAITCTEGLTDEGQDR